jgi:hypothetical protein
LALQEGLSSVDFVTEYNFKAPDTMKIEDKIGGHIAPMG